MVGKKVSQDISTYLTGVNPKEFFMKAEPALSLIHITSVNNHAAIDELRKMNETLTIQYDLFSKRVALMEEEYRSFATNAAEVLGENNINPAGKRWLEELRNRQKREGQTANT